MYKQTMRKASVFVLISLVLLFLAVAPAARAQFKSFNWEDWDVDIVLLANGDLQITENQTLYFSGAPFTFGYRSIPTGSTGQNDGIRDISVRQGDRVFTESSSNAPGTFEVLDQGGEARINWYFEPALGDQTYTFSYTVEGAVRTGTLDQGDGDQIFWTVIPADHPAYVANSRTTITLPEGVAPQQYTGTTDYLVAAYINGTKTDDVAIAVSDDGRTITYELLRPLDTNEKLEVRVQFPHGPLPIETPSWQAAQQQGDVVRLAMLALSILLLIGGPLSVLFLWYTRGRDPKLGIVVPEYITSPPDDLPPAMVGTLVDERADMDDITSSLVDLAHRGYLTMEQQKKNGGYLYKRTDKPADNLRQYEQTFLKKFFGRKDEVTLESMRYNFSSNLPTLRDELYDALVTEGYVPRSPQTVRSAYTALAAAVLILGIGGIILLSALFDGFAVVSCLPMLAILATSVALFLAARHMPVKTEKGVVATERWLAFKQYLKNIKEYDDLEQAGDIFEQYLAYAVCFGLERSFISTFAASPNTPIPSWYFPYPPIMMGGPGTFGGASSGGGSVGGGGASMPRPSLEGMSGNLSGGLAAMSVGLTQMLNSTNSVLQSTRPSSSGSGSFGGSSGGFSGGFSGGGGGGFSGGGGGSGGFG